ncbi:MAG: DUF1727 domain-containing protein [Thermoleophilaceae bacterium]|nr:DUF1727 domain-containing protein [Thermoleophilaceae bacterium]
MIFRIEVALARLARRFARLLGRSGGTTLPGRALLSLQPRAIEKLAARLGGGVTLVSATNGKTTTTTMLAAAFGRAGSPPVTNGAGSNMHWGVATALLGAERDTGARGVFEVDEAWLVPVAEQTRPDQIVLGNLFRDQLDRYGELEYLADSWAELTRRHGAGTQLVLNADDPLVADLGRDRENVVYFGVEDPGQRRPGLAHAADSKRCRNCGANYVYDAVYLGHLGDYHCTSCGRRRPTADVAANVVRLDGMRGSEVEVTTPAGKVALSLSLPGLYNVYNALAALAAAVASGIDPARVADALREMPAAFGRVERIPIARRELAVLLIKNPVGADEVLRTLSLEDGRLDLWIALNDGIADGRDISWIWDAEFELLAGRVRSVTCSGRRAAELALRLKYAGIGVETTVEPDIERSLDAALAQADAGTLYALPTYTALLELRSLLARRGAAPRWSA